MPAQTHRIAIAALIGFAVFAQGPQEQDRVFRFAHTETAAALQEIATVIRSTGDIRQLTVDPAQRTLSLRGTAVQIALVEWLFHRMDQPANRHASATQAQGSVTHEYRLPDGGDDIVRVFYLTHAATPQETQEIATILRSTADVRRVFLYNGLRALILRSAAAQMAMAEWLVNELDQPRDRQTESKHEYRPGGDDVLRVFYLKAVSTPQDLQEVATILRSTADIRRVFTLNASRAVTLRGTVAQVAMAEWLIKELERAENRAAPNQGVTSPRTYRAQGGDDDVVSVFFLSSTETPQSLQQIAMRIRTSAEIRRIFSYNSARALTLRGTAQQIAHAERLFQERNK
jgi:hypothetical protein